MHPSKLTKVDIESMEAYKFHKELAAKRGKDFEKNLNYLKEHQALVVMDFKANISLGKGPEQDSHVFFKAPQRIVFGAVVYFRKKEDQQIYKVI